MVSKFSLHSSASMIFVDHCGHLSPLGFPGLFLTSSLNCSLQIRDADPFEKTHHDHLSGHVVYLVGASGVTLMLLIAILFRDLVLAL